MAEALTAITTFINLPYGVFAAGGVLAGIVWKFSERVEALLAETTIKRKRRLKQGAGLYRAQLGHDLMERPLNLAEGVDIMIEERAPFSDDRMVPRPYRAAEGRVNPKGIPCLYLSDDLPTAVTEVRPWIGTFVSVAMFATARELTVLDSSIDIKEPPFMSILEDAPEAGTLEQAIWWAIDEALSEPVARTDDTADYAPTQVLAEFFKSIGCDGIVYKSKLGKGRNVALFNLKDATFANCQLYKIDGMTATFSEASEIFYRSTPKQ